MIAFARSWLKPPDAAPIGRKAMHVGRLAVAGYVDGVGPCDRATPRQNWTGDPYYTDGKRAILFLSESRTTPKYIADS
jgi:hypothetical protein